jgi:hypothetical protein
MSIFDDIPLEVGTEYYGNTILDWNPEDQKYLVARHSNPEGRWLSRQNVETYHANSLMEGVEVREAKPGNGYNTRFFRSRT